MQRFFDFKNRFIDKSKLRILAFINIAHGGMVSLASELEPDNFYVEIAAAIAKEVPEVVGVKTAHYHVGKPFDQEHPAWASVDAAVKAGKLQENQLWQMYSLICQADLMRSLF
ncbi:MAG: hypothetical protein ACLVBP_12415 [Ruminococcus sp.]